MRVRILNTWVDALDIKQTVNEVDQYIKTDRPLHLMGVNAEKINLVNRDRRFAEIVNECGIINADGCSVVMASRFLKKVLPERVAGIDLMMTLIALCEKKGYSVYFLGSKADIVEKMVAVIGNDYPNLNICGYRDGYFNEYSWEEIANSLRDMKPQVVFVGITSPTKEYLISFFQSRGLSSVFMGVGGSFDVISGAISRAPLWMRKINLEWLYRVIKEPRRLWKRYLVGNIEFIARVFVARCLKETVQPSTVKS